MTEGLVVKAGRGPCQTASASARSWRARTFRLGGGFVFGIDTSSILTRSENEKKKKKKKKGNKYKYKRPVMWICLYLFRAATRDA